MVTRALTLVTLGLALCAGRAEADTADAKVPGGGTFVSRPDVGPHSRIGLRAGLVYYDVTGDTPAPSTEHGLGGALTLQLARLEHLGEDGCGSRWHFFFGPRVAARHVGLASTGALTVIAGFTTDGAGAAPEFSLTASAGVALEEDRSQLAHGLLFGLDLSIAASIGWRIDETTAIVFDVGLGGVIAWRYEAFVLAPFSMAYEVSW